jgi:hypothetical protein
MASVGCELKDIFVGTYLPGSLTTFAHSRSNVLDRASDHLSIISRVTHHVLFWCCNQNQSPTLTALMLAVVPPVSLGAVCLPFSLLITFPSEGVILVHFR